MLPVFDAPAWTMKALVVTLVVAFLPCIGLAWAFELTPQGIKRDADIPACRQRAALCGHVAHPRRGGSHRRRIGAVDEAVRPSVWRSVRVTGRTYSIDRTCAQGATAQGRWQAAIESSAKRQPGGLWRLYSAYLSAVGRLDDAESAIRKSIELRPQCSSAWAQLAIIQIQRGDPKAALDAAKREPGGVWHDIAMAMALQVGPDRVLADAALKNSLMTKAMLPPIRSRRCKPCATMRTPPSTGLNTHALVATPASAIP